MLDEFNALRTRARINRDRAPDAFKRQIHAELQLLELKADFIEGE
jgi:hypothetical protein